MSSAVEKLSAYARPEAWVLEPEPSTFAPNNKWSNKDMDPVPARGVSPRCLRAAGYSLPVRSRANVEDVDDIQLYRVLAVGCDERRGVGARVEYACDWTLVVRLLVRWLMFFDPRASSVSTCFFPVPKPTCTFLLHRMFCLFCLLSAWP